MKVKTFTFNMFGVNTYIVWNPQSLEAAIIDPGMMTDEDKRIVADFIKINNLKLVHLINTHLHIDHTFGDDFMSQNYGLKLEAHPDDAPMGQRRASQARAFGLMLSPEPIEIDVELHDGDKIFIGNEYLQVRHLPGHSPGSVILYSPVERIVFTGDVLFQRSIGRTDLPGGSHAALIDGIHHILMPMPDDTVVYPGHGSPTTIGEERTGNIWIGHR